MNINTFVYQPASMITWTMLYMDSNNIRTTLASQPYTHMYGTLASGWISRLKPTTLKHHSNTLRTSRCRRALSLRLAVKVWSGPMPVSVPSRLSGETSLAHCLSGILSTSVNDLFMRPWLSGLQSEDAKVLESPDA